MSTSTGPDAIEAQLVHEPTGFRTSIEDIFKPYASSDVDVRGKCDRRGRRAGRAAH
jgi:hypothetical protein